VVHAVRLAGLQDLDVDPELAKLVRPALERDDRAELVVDVRLRVRDVDDEPVRAGQS
jgi:hypothetical protein